MTDIVRPEKPVMRMLYLIATTLLLLASLGLLEVATLPHSPVVAPTRSGPISGHDADESNPVGRVDGMR